MSRGSLGRRRSARRSRARTQTTLGMRAADPTLLDALLLLLLLLPLLDAAWTPRPGGGCCCWRRRPPGLDPFLCPREPVGGDIPGCGALGRFPGPSGESPLQDPRGRRGARFATLPGATPPARDKTTPGEPALLGESRDSRTLVPAGSVSADSLNRGWNLLKILKAKSWKYPSLKMTLPGLGIRWSQRPCYVQRSLVSAFLSIRGGLGSDSPWIQEVLCYIARSLDPSCGQLC